MHVVLYNHGGGQEAESKSTGQEVNEMEIDSMTQTDLGQAVNGIVAAEYTFK